MKNRFKAVEMGIFAVVSLIFLNSVYNLFTDGKFIGDNERRPLAAYKPAGTAPKPLSEGGKPGAPAPGGADRATASAAPEGISGFVPYETKCQTTGEVFETSAAKVRILGPFCGANARGIAGQASAVKTEIPVTDYKVENTTTRYVATVFSDVAAGKFSTDFIPLDTGTNKIMMEFRYKGGKVFPVELTVVRK